MGINKVVVDGNTKFDITGITVAPDKMLKGTTAVNNLGEPIVGTIDTEMWELTLEDGSIVTKEVTVV